MKKSNLIAVLLLVVFTVLAVSSIWPDRKSPTCDELAHHFPFRGRRCLRRRSGRLPLAKGRQTMAMKSPPHPGRSIQQNCLDALGLTVTEAAKVLGVARHTLSRVLNGHAGISPEMAIRLEKAGWSRIVRLRDGYASSASIVWHGRSWRTAAG